MHRSFELRGKTLENVSPVFLAVAVALFLIGCRQAKLVEDSPGAWSMLRGERQARARALFPDTEPEHVWSWNPRSTREDFIPNGPPVCSAAGRTVFVNASGQLICLSPAGRLIWSRSLLQPYATFAPLIVADGVVCPSNRAKFLEEQTSKLEKSDWDGVNTWSAMPRNDMGGYLTSPNQTLNGQLVCHDTLYLYMFDQAGKELWSRDLQMMIGCDGVSQTESGNIVLTLSTGLTTKEEGHVICLDDNGKVVWECDTIKGSMRMQPVCSEDVTYIATLQGLVSAIGTDGKFLWQTKLPTGTSRAVALSKNDALLLAGSYPSSALDRWHGGGDTLYVLDAGTGKFTTIVVGEGISDVVAHAFEPVAMVLHREGVTCFDIARGKQVWTVPLVDAEFGSLAVHDDGTVIVSDSSGGIHALKQKQ